MATTAQTIIDGAFDLCGIKQAGESMSSTDNTDALRRLNNFIQILNNQNLVSAFQAREVWPLTADKGTYTIGPGGDFDTTRPLSLDGVAILQSPTITSSLSITAVSTTNDTFTVAGDQTALFTNGSEFVVSGSTGNDGCYTVSSSAFSVSTVITCVEAVFNATADGSIAVFTASSSTVEIPRTLYTNAAWQGVQVKSLTNSLPTGIYFSPNYSRGLATLTCWPIPDIATNALVLYRANQLATFADLATTSYEIPAGFEEVLEYGLAMRLGTPYAISNPEVKADIQRIYASSMAVVKRTNQMQQLSDMQIDPAWTHDRRGYYNINTSNG